MLRDAPEAPPASSGQRSLPSLVKKSRASFRARRDSWGGNTPQSRSIIARCCGLHIPVTDRYSHDWIAAPSSRGAAVQLREKICRSMLCITAVRILLSQSSLSFSLSLSPSLPPSLSASGRAPDRSTCAVSRVSKVREPSWSSSMMQATLHMSQG